MDANEAIAKVAKLLRLARSDNANEAALAAARAQEIIDRYKLTGIDLALDGSKVEPDEGIKNFEEYLDGNPNGRSSTWKGRLAMKISRANQCRVYSHGGALKLVGRPSDAEVVRYLYAFLVREIDRLALQEARGNGKTWANNFRLGCVDTISQKLDEQKKATVQSVQNENPNAIVLVQNAMAKMERRAADVDAFMKSTLHLVSKSSPLIRLDNGAREAGRQAAKSISFGNRGSLGVGARSLPA